MTKRMPILTMPPYFPERVEGSHRGYRLLIRRSDSDPDWIWFCAADSENNCVLFSGSGYHPGPLAELLPDLEAQVDRCLAQRITWRI